MCTEESVKNIQSSFKEFSNIITWSIDQNDIDNVLRIETNGFISESDIIRLVCDRGYKCEELNY